MRQANPDDALRRVALSLLRHVAQFTEHLPIQLMLDVQWHISDFSATAGNSEIYRVWRFGVGDVMVRRSRLPETDVKVVWSLILG